MKKKLIALVCALALAVGLVGCSLSTPCLLYTSPSPRD